MLVKEEAGLGILNSFDSLINEIDQCMVHFENAGPSFFVIHKDRLEFLIPGTEWLACAGAAGQSKIQTPISQRGRLGLHYYSIIFTRGFITHHLSLQCFTYIQNACS